MASRLLSQLRRVPSRIMQKISILPAEYANPAYWETRYQRYPITRHVELESQPHLTGTRPTRTCGSYLRDTSRNRHTFSTSEPAAQVRDAHKHSLELPVEMHKDGYRHIVSIDVAESAVARMKKRYGAKYPKLICIRALLHEVVETMDARKMRFSDQEFDCAVDKATLDSLIVFDFACSRIEREQNRYCGRDRRRGESCGDQLRSVRGGLVLRARVPQVDMEESKDENTMES